MQSYRSGAVILLSLILLVFPLALTFAGGQAEAEGAELDFLTLFSGGEGDIMAGLISEFNEQNAEVNVNEIPVEWEEYYTRLMTSILADDPPDVGVMHLALLPDYVEGGVVQPVGQFLPDGLADSIQDHIVEGATFNGDLYAIPIDTHPLVLYYNETVLREAGLVDSDDEVLVPTTWDELIDYGVQIREETDHHGVGYAGTGSGGAFGERAFIAVYHQLGGELYNEATGQLDLDEQLAAETYDELMRVFDEDLTQGTSEYEENNSLFMADDLGFLFNGVWTMALYPDEVEAFGVTEFPLVAGDVHYTWADSHALVLPAQQDDSRVEAAAGFSTWISENSVAWAEAGHLPVNTDVLESAEFLDMPMREDYLAAGENAILAPPVEGWESLREEMVEIGERLILGELTSEEAAAALSEEIENNQ